jgi:ABC-type branched-subunit amino acid transport system ATPase component
MVPVQRIGPTRPEGVVLAGQAPPALRVDDLRRSFYGVSVLQGISLSIAAGSITGLIGPNGAGKSTFFNVISGLLRPDQGRVSLGGRNVTGMSPDRLVGCGLVRTFQLARGFPKLSVFQHLMLYAPRQPGEHMLAAIFGSRQARAYEAEIAERAWSVARRLRLGHVLDNGITICLIEHDMSLIKRLCDPVIVLAEGRTLMTGSFAEVVDDPRVQEAYLGTRH